MTCCPADAAGPAATDERGPDYDLPVDARPWIRTANGVHHLDLIVPEVHCAGCIRSIEGDLNAVPGVESARVNLSTRRLAVSWRGPEADGNMMIGRLARLGFQAQPFDAESTANARDTVGDTLLRSIAVAGFAAGNIMLLSVSVWSGADASTRDLFHWISALIALPAIAYAGRPFYRSALAALSARRLNMDVPISLAVLLAAGMSVFETALSGAHAYFDAAVMLLFFLLIGRYLDHMMRARARSAATQLLALQGSAATVIDENGARRCVRIAELKTGNRVAVAAGERIPADGRVVSGSSDLDRSMVTGETVPEPVEPGRDVHAGTLNLTGPIELEVTAAGSGTLLAEIVRLMEAAEQGRARYVRLADRAARLYAPVVHLLALVTFIGWFAATGDWRTSLFVAISVLVITCPCALALAVPAVQVVAAGALLKRGIMVKEGDALEKLADVDTVVFDKTGTLTEGRPRLTGGPGDGQLAIAAGLAVGSRHPLSRAIVQAAAERGIEPVPVDDVREHPGRGLEGRHAGRAIRLGRRDWVGGRSAEDDGLLELWLDAADKAPTRFAFVDAPRCDAAAVVAALRERGMEVLLLSGDRASAVRQAAGAAGIDNVEAGCEPAGKVAVLERLRGEGRRVLMVGDGINDAPALSAALVSMSPSSAADISQTSAGLVFTGERLAPVLDALDIAHLSTRLVKQNFGLSLAYNVIAVPIAVAGFATPLVAAIAMSSSSLLVTANALRLRLGGRRAVPSPAALAGGKTIERTV